MTIYDSKPGFFNTLLSIINNVLNQDNTSVVSYLNSFGVLLKEMGSYTDAEQLFSRLLATQEEKLGPNHPDLVDSLINMAIVYHRSGLFEKAEEYLLRALEIQKTANVSNKINEANILNTLSLLYSDMGDYKKAETMLKDALCLLEGKYQSSYPLMPQLMVNLAILYGNSGLYEKAEKTYCDAIAIQEKSLGLNSPEVANSYHNLACLYYDMGNYIEAEKLLRKAIDIRENRLGKTHPILASSLNSLGIIYQDTGNYLLAEKFHRRAWKIRERILEPTHIDIGRSLHSVALLCHRIGAYDEAELHYKNALSIHESTLGKNHPDVAMILFNLALLFTNKGSFAQAEKYNQHALEKRRKVWGDDHPEVAASLINIANVYLKQRNYKKAFNALQESIAISEKLINDVFMFASDRQKQSFILKHKHSLHLLLEITFDHFKSDLKKVSAITDQWFRRQGRLLESQRLLIELLLTDNNVEVRRIAEDYRKTTMIWNSLAFSGPGHGGIEQYKANLDEIQKQHDDLEKKLLKLSSKFQEFMKPREIGWRQVADALPEGAVLIDFASLWDKRFLAFIVHFGSDKCVQLIDLGSGEEISKLIRDLRIEIRKGKDKNIGFDDKLYHQLSRKLYQKIIKPLKGALGAVGHYIISPDGALCLLPFEILINENDEYLMEEEGRLITYITAPRDLLYGPVGEKRNRALMIGDPDYDWDGYIDSESDSGYTPLDSEDNKDGRRSFLLDDHRFGRIKNTTYEVDEIASHLIGKYEHRTPFTRWEAREELLSEARDFGIIHIATHGFFLPIERRKEKGTLAQDEKHAFPMVRSADIEAEVYVENPLLRSGLAFAGANVTLDKKTGSQGILTAEKVLSLPLRGTDLLVLSACETGMGDVNVGEGVFGLQRAFSIAGVANLVMSLWKVPDYETKTFMVKFYNYMIEDKENPRIALSKATKDQLKMMRDRFDTDHPNPYFWSGFVLSGRP